MSDNKNNEMVPVNDARKQEIVKAMTDVEFYPTVIDKPEDMSRYNVIPLTKIAATGTAFDSIVAAFNFVTNGGKASSGIYRVVVENGGELMKFKDGKGYLGAVKAANGGVGGGQAVLNPLVCNPATLCMAITLISMDRKLDKIQKLQKEMFEYIKQKDKAKLKGNLNFLSDIINNYKFNWNNKTYKQTHLIKTQDIKQSAEGSIEHYQSMIRSKVREKGFLKTSQQVQKQLNEVEDMLQDYSLALYIHAFASFLEVMLLENFDSGYLHSVRNKIEGYSIRYREIYTDSYDRIERALDKSLQGHVLGGLAKFNEGAGQVIEKIPVIEKTPLDEGLGAAGKTLSKVKSKAISRRMRGFESNQKTQVRPFLDNINMVDAMYNEPLELMFDEEYLYIEG